MDFSFAEVLAMKDGRLGCACFSRIKDCLAPPDVRARQECERMDSWYFAYGSNLWIDQMIARTGSIGHPEHRPRIASLADHRLVFQHLENEVSAFANIVFPGDGVLGVLYRCSLAHLDVLDRYEDGYERQTIEAIDQQGEVLSAVAYVIQRTRPSIIGRPSEEYLGRIVNGARQHGLPESYIEAIINRAAAEVIEGSNLADYGR